ncbi:family 16 glycosylhydrolase [Candidatus Sumerlaeota bacterium]|nr:family 16 glycosylhydrolase [Candidatus Sumerlaeota bacterium]
MGIKVFPARWDASLCSAALLMLVFLSGVWAEPPVPAPEGYRWEIVWQDEFSGDQLDKDRWTLNYPWSREDSLGGKQRGENYIHPSHVALEDGTLVLKNSENIYPADYPLTNEGRYYLMNKAASECLVMMIMPQTASVPEQTTFAMVPFNRIPEKEFALWFLEKDEEDQGKARLMNVRLRKQLTSTTASLTLAAADSSDAQVWQLQPVEGDEGWHWLQNKRGGEYLSVDSGKVVMRLLSGGSEQKWKLYCQLPWIAGVVTNFQKFKMQRPGYLETSIKLPETTGAWPSFWLLRDGWPPEVDVFDYFSNEPYMTHKVHFRNNSGQNDSSMRQYKVDRASFEHRFHNYGIFMGSDTLDVPNAFIWFIDGEPCHYWGAAQFFNQFYDMYILLTQSNGDAAGYPDSSTKFPNYLQCDWMRYWELKPYEGARVGWIKVDDSSARVKYEGQWGVYGGNRGFLNTEHYSENIGSRATFTFTGTLAKVYGMQRDDLGHALIYLDGERVKTVDCYGAKMLPQHKLYETPVLPLGEHTVAVEVSGQKDEPSSGYELIVDAFEYYRPSRPPIAETAEETAEKAPRELEESLE